jgi:multiple sugar transport system substrate-binding protein
MRRRGTGIRGGAWPLCAGLAVVMLAGCGGMAMRSEEEVVTFSAWGALQDQIVYKKIIEDFETEHPDTEVSLMFIPYSNYFTKLQLLLIGRVAPDVALASSQMAYHLKENDHLVSLQPFIERERESHPGFFTDENLAIEGLRPLFTFDGDVYYIPTGPQTLHLYVNVSHFEDAGVALPDGAWTWDDFLDAARRLTVHEEDGPTRWGFLCPNWVDVWRCFLLQNEADLFDSFAEPTRCTLDEPAAIETFAFLQDLIHRYRVSPSPLQATQAVNTDFMTGRLAMTIHGTWMIEQYRTITRFEWDMAPLPRRKRYATLTSCGGYGMTTQNDDPERAWAFLKGFLSKETQRIMGGQCALWQPLRSDVAAEDPMSKLPGLPEHHHLRYTELERSSPMLPLHHPEAQRIMDMIIQGVEPIFQGEEQPEDLLPELAAEVTEAIREEGP